MHKYWYTILLSFSLFIAAAAAMIGGVLMKPEAGKTVKQDFAASAAVRDPAFPYLPLFRQLFRRLCVPPTP